MNSDDISSTMRDMYPRPGERIKQWVVDMRREAQWERETCPRFFIGLHDDNTGAVCRNSPQTMAGVSTWVALHEHDCCTTCNDLAAVSKRSSVQAWLIEKAARPPIEPDRTKLSNEVQLDLAFGESPFLAMVRR